MAPRPTATERARERRASAQTCDVRGCSMSVTGLSRYCDQHDKRNERTGHPEGRTIRKGELRPFVKLASAFIETHRGHPGIAAALEWIGQQIAEAKDPTHLSSRSTAAQRLGRWLSRMRREGVSPEEVLATVIAIFVFREDRPHDFHSDRHFRHQLAVRVLRLVPAPFVNRWTGSGTRRAYDRLTVATRECLSDRFITALGLLALRAAKEIMREINRPDPDKLAGADVPFAATYN